MALTISPFFKDSKVIATLFSDICLIPKLMRSFSTSTSIIFASDTFITLIKQIAEFGIPFSVAFRIVILNLPSIIVMTIPLGVLMATVMTLNKLSLSSEITVLRSCGIGLNRIAKPIFIFAIAMSVCCFVVNESIVPVMSKQAKDLALWSFSQKNIPEGKENFVFKELNDNNGLKRLFYVGNCKHKVLHDVTVLDSSKEGTIQILQAVEGNTSAEGWNFFKGAIYTVSNDGKILNTSLFDKFNIKFAINLSKELNKNVAREMNFGELIKYIAKQDFGDICLHHIVRDIEALTKRFDLLRVKFFISKINGNSDEIKMLWIKTPEPVQGVKQSETVFAA